MYGASCGSATAEPVPTWPGGTSWMRTPSAVRALTSDAMCSRPPMRAQYSGFTPAGSRPSSTSPVSRSSKANANSPRIRMSAPSGP